MGANGRRNGLPCCTKIQTATIQITLEIPGVGAGIDELKEAPGALFAHWRRIG